MTLKLSILGNGLSYMMRSFPGTQLDIYFDMKKLLILLGITICFTACTKCEDTKDEEQREYGRSSIDSALIKEAKRFCSANDMNTEFFLLADLNTHSGKKRLFLWDFNKGAVDTFLVSHGCGPYRWASDQSKESPVISNMKDSHCSSIGKYRLGERGYSNFGGKVKYILQGLEDTNSNAQSRTIVFHSWEAVTDYEIFPIGTAEGWGCPAISINAFNKIDKRILSSNKNVLLWMIKPDDNHT